MESWITITKSTRHAKIVGDFGEHLVCNWLSRSGFEVSIVDHTGIDLIAYHPKTKERLGIAVTSRTRVRKEAESVNLLKGAGQDRKKLMAACKAFACEPWLAVYVECRDTADLFLTSLANYDKKYRSKKGTLIDTWKMSKLQKLAYSRNSMVRHLRFKIDPENWWPPRPETE